MYENLSSYAFAISNTFHYVSAEHSPHPKILPPQSFSKKRKFPLAFSGEVCYTKAVGAWLSLVERFLGVEEVVGSNPVAPTSLVFSRL